MTARIVVLISGSGSNLQALIDAVNAGDLAAEIGLVVSNRKKAYGLERAAEADIPTLYFPLKPYKTAVNSREAYDADLADKVLAEKPDLIGSTGFHGVEFLTVNFSNELHEFSLISCFFRDNSRNSLQFFA